MTTTDGRWRMDAVHRGASSWYRLRHDDNIVDGLTITKVERVLGRAGVDLGDLHQAADPSAPSRDATA
jgi:hypothetical protein